MYKCHRNRIYKVIVAYIIYTEDSILNSFKDIIEIHLSMKIAKLQWQQSCQYNIGYSLDFSTAESSFLIILRIANMDLRKTLSEDISIKLAILSISQNKPLCKNIVIYCKSYFQYILCTFNDFFSFQERNTIFKQMHKNFSDNEVN